MAYTLGPRIGERFITPRQVHEISAQRLAEFERELETIAERDGLVVSIEWKNLRGYCIQWAPIEMQWPW